MDSRNYSLANLWPDFGALLNGEISTPEGLSALVVGVLFCCTIFFMFWSIWNFLKARQHLKFYLELLSGLTVEQLLEKRRDISNKALSNLKYGQLWKEFDESLVHIPHKKRLCNTLDAEHFFSTHSISRGLTENRLLAAVPGFLTAIGVIGTFGGLQMGLSQLSGNVIGDTDVDSLKNGIFGMIGGASIAFMTSVWGVTTSVVFNFFEKFLERKIRADISDFQNQVDYLYPRITAEQSLSNIEDSSRVSSEKLAELDEKIGHRLQEAMQQASTSIREGMEQSLTTILAPAIDKLVNNAHSGSEKALESLLERFMGSVGSAGNAQKEMMDNASSQMLEATDSMTSGLHDFLSKLDNQFETMVQKNESTLSVVQSAMSEQMDAQQGREIARQNIINDQLKGVQNTQSSLSQSVESVLETQKKQSDELVMQMQRLAEQFSHLSSSHAQATDSMKQVASDMKASSNQLGLLSVNLKESVDFIGDDLETLVSQVSALSKQNESLGNHFESVSSKIVEASSKIESASLSFDSAATKAEGGLKAVDSHFDSLGNSLKVHVQDLEKHISTLLTEYSQQVQSQTSNRMNEWNGQTNQYISSMTDAVRTLSGVVDEIETKIRA